MVDRIVHDNVHSQIWKALLKCLLGLVPKCLRGAARVDHKWVFVLSQCGTVDLVNGASLDGHIRRFLGGRSCGGHGCGWRGFGEHFFKEVLEEFEEAGLLLARLWENWVILIKTQNTFATATATAAILSMNCCH